MSLPPELQAILLACAIGPGLAVVHVILFRLRGEGAAGQMPLYASFVVLHAAWLLAAYATWGERLTLGQSIAGLSTCSFGCLAFMQVYSQICRGFSLRIMVDIDRCDGLDIEGILREYADGRGARWLLDKRIDTLVETGLLVRTNDGIALGKPAAKRLGEIGILFKRVVKPAQGG